MPTTLTDFDDTPVEETANEGPGQDMTLEDLGTDKEINTPPADAPAQDEFEADKQEEADTEEAKESEAEPAKPADQAAPKTEADKTTEEILKHLGMDSPLKIKGKEYKLSDFAKDDILAYVQKGIRMTQIGQELSKKEQLLAERERLAEQNALQATQMLSQYQQAPAGQAKVETQPPPELVPSEYDTEDIKAVKQAALTVWKQNQDQAQRLNTIEGGLKHQQSEAETKQFLDELMAHKSDFPLASTEEVIAVHSLRPDIPLSDLVRRSHAIYGSAEHIREVFKHAPEVRKEVEDEIIAAYLARNSKAKVVPQKPSTQGARPVPATKSAIRGFEDAGQAAKRALAQMARELEGDND